jgi:hypothetical protein
MVTLGALREAWACLWVVNELVTLIEEDSWDLRTKTVISFNLPAISGWMFNSMIF